MPKTRSRKRIPSQLRHAKSWRAPRRRYINGTAEANPPTGKPVASSEPLPGPHTAEPPRRPLATDEASVPIEERIEHALHELLNIVQAGMRELKPNPTRFDSSKVRLAQPEANKFMGELFERHALTLPEGGFVLSSLLWATALKNTGNDPRMARELVNRTFDIFAGRAAPFAPVLLR